MIPYSLQYLRCGVVIGINWVRAVVAWVNTVADSLLEGFSLYERGYTSLEDIRDNTRRLIARSPRGPAFGYYTSIENVFSHLFKTNAIVSERYYVCSIGHHVHHSNDHDAFLSAGVHEYESIVQWVSTETHHARARCEICDMAVNISLGSATVPLSWPLLSSVDINIDNTFRITSENSDHTVTYTLAAVIYYGNQHFTAQIVTRDGRIWFYDGMN